MTTATNTIAMIDTLDALTPRYDAVLCDVWGVVHNGVRVFSEATAALRRARESGLPVVLITNAPRPHADVERQLETLGTPADCFDAVVTSGDVTRALISEGSRRVFHLGPERDYPIFEGLDVELVEEFEASSVVCTGLFDDDTETPEDYAGMLARMRARDLPFICANPDIVVERGDRLVWCAGALARDYGQLGGRTIIAGKPHRPIYEASIAAAEQLLDRPLARERVLAIGDGIMTDVKGASGFGLDVLYVTGGIHAREYAGPKGADPQRLADFLERHGYHPVAAIEKLR